MLHIWKHNIGYYNFQGSCVEKSSHIICKAVWVCANDYLPTDLKQRIVAVNKVISLYE